MMWRVSIFVTVKGKEIIAGSKTFPTEEIARIEAARMERRQPPHLLPRSFVAPLA